MWTRNCAYSVFSALRYRIVPPTALYTQLYPLHTMWLPHSRTIITIFLMKDAIDKEYSGLSLETKMEAVLRRQLLSSATETLTHFAGSTQQRSVSLEALDAVAKMRYALLVVAELLQLQVNQQGGALVGGHTHYLYGRTASILIEEAR